ncbi:STAS/SEC14 domain-containing protein [Aliiroseovarius sp. 2305UL8-7]|uniref:STAS/SEC14 domain-containing protein n=1 Tax=Aliiroseovarius conchicola TaxID=3121637 RepID=UPI00352862C4
MLNPINEARSGVLAFDAIGKLNDGDYKTILIPAIEDYLKSAEKAHLLLRFGPDFEGYTLHAMADDALLGMRHMRDFERIAIVTDHAWLAQGVRLFAPLSPVHMKVFGLAETDSAMSWVAW